MPEVHHVKVWLYSFCLIEEVNVLQAPPNLIVPTPLFISFHTLESSKGSRPALTHTKRMNGVFGLRRSKTAPSDEHLVQAHTCHCLSVLEYLCMNQPQMCGLAARSLSVGVPCLSTKPLLIL